MDTTPRLALEVTKGLLSIVLAILSLAMLYEVAGHYQGKDLSVKWVVLTIFPASYLWWLVEQFLRRLGVQRSAGFSLLIAVALSIWLLAISEKLNLTSRAGSLVEAVWDGLEAALIFLIQLIP